MEAVRGTSLVGCSSVFGKREGGVRRSLRKRLSSGSVETAGLACFLQTGSYRYRRVRIASICSSLDRRCCCRQDVLGFFRDVYQYSMPRQCSKRVLLPHEYEELIRKSIGRSVRAKHLPKLNGHKHTMFRNAIPFSRDDSPTAGNRILTIRAPTPRKQRRRTLGEHC